MKELKIFPLAACAVACLAVGHFAVAAMLTNAFFGGDEILPPG